MHSYAAASISLLIPGLVAGAEPRLTFRQESKQAVAVTADYSTIVFKHPPDRSTELHVVGMKDGRRLLTISVG